MPFVKAKHPQEVISQLPQGVKHGVVGHPQSGIVAQFAAQFVALPVGDNFNHHVRRFAKLPDKVGAVALLAKVLGRFHIQANEHIGHNGRLTYLGKNANVGVGDEGPIHAQTGPRTVENLHQQPLQLGRQKIIHGGIVLNHQVVNIRPRFWVGGR